jgi:hypothetical protein
MPCWPKRRKPEREIRAGGQRGPLHGVPVGIKDIIDVAGQATTCHSKIYLQNIARADAEVVSRLRAAGAIPFGKLSLHEFAIGGPSFDLPFPPARNPWNRDHHPGGSSSGSGTALAAGFLPLALGTDTGGSIRNPAGNCGVVGLKPTYGLVSRRGVFPLAFTLDHIGPMARTVRDTALALDVLAGHDAADPGSAAISHGNFGADLERRLCAVCAWDSCGISRTGRAGPSRSNGRARGGRETVHARRRIGPRPSIARRCRSLPECRAYSCSPSRGRCTRRGCATGPGTTQKLRAAN